MKEMGAMCVHSSLSWKVFIFWKDLKLEAFWFLGSEWEQWWGWWW